MTWQKLLAAVPMAILAMPGVCELPPVPVPSENPITEEKRVLGKILFWDEQLSSDDTVACGTCHRPYSGGADPRAGLNPGQLPGTFDDVAGSPGIRRFDAAGLPVADPVFGNEVQITPRTAPSVFGALWATEVFWDGRAGTRLIDPVSGAVVIETGAALENQALASLANPAEMAKPGRTWDELSARLGEARPLALADHWPDDVRTALAQHDSYPALFEAAFGDPAISAVRIAMAIASYERTLVADDTAWDRYIAGDNSAFSSFERYGWQSFQAFKCVNCHEPPLFTNNEFANIGVRRGEYDAGRQRISGNSEDAGDMKVPSLRNVGLRARYMHTGEFGALGDVVSFYREASQLSEVDDIPGSGAYTFGITLQSAADLTSFLTSALSDDRVAAEVYPFDRPRLASER